MELVDSRKLFKIAQFMTNIEVNGNYLCGSFLEFLDGELDAPKCVDDESLCMEDCPIKGIKAFIKWIKKPYSNLYRNLEKPKQEDFIESDCSGDGHVNDFHYAKALERYCNSLEEELTDTEYDLDSALCDNEALLEKLEKIRGVLDEHY